MSLNEDTEKFWSELVNDRMAAVRKLRPGDRVYMKAAHDFSPGGWGDFIGLVDVQIGSHFPFVVLEDYKPRNERGGAYVEFDNPPTRFDIYEPMAVLEGRTNAERLKDQDPRRLLRGRTAIKLAAEIEALRADTNKKIDELNARIVKQLTDETK